MADLNISKCVAIATQSAVDSFVGPAAATDSLACSNLQISYVPHQVDNPEYTGNVHKAGPTIIGKGFRASMTVTLRGPGGVAPPAADAFVLGRLLKAMGFAESILSAAIPVAPEALGAATTTSVTLGATAVATANLYKGLLVGLSALGSLSSIKSFTALRSYSVAKLALLGETFLSAPTGNYQIPKQLAYLLSGAPTFPYLSGRFWDGGIRHDVMNLTVESARLNFPTSNRENPVYPTIDVTLVGDLVNTYDDACPTPPFAGPPPFIRDGDFWVGGKALPAGQTTIDLGISVGFPPNPNKSTGADAGQIVGTQRSASVEYPQVSKATFDPVALADAQGNIPLWLMYGSATGNIISVMITDARPNYPTNGSINEFVSNSIDLIVDGANRDIAIVIPYL